MANRVLLVFIIIFYDAKVARLRNYVKNVNLDPKAIFNVPDPLTPAIKIARNLTAAHDQGVAGQLSITRQLEKHAICKYAWEGA